MKTKLILIFAGVFMALQFHAQQWNGHTLYAANGGYTCNLMDTNGIVIHSWPGLPGATRYSCYMLGGGSVIRTCGTNYSITPTHGGMYARIQIVDWNGNITWDWNYNEPTGRCLHHDIAVMPNGHILAIVAETVSAANFSLAGGTNTSISTFLTEKVIEVEPQGLNGGNIIWEWKLWDHLVQNVNPNANNYYPSIVGHSELLNINFNVQADLMHMNGIDYNPVLDQIALSSRYKDELYIIDHSTTTAEAATHSGGLSGRGGDFLYRWGNPAAYQAPGPKILDAPHDAHWIPEDCPDAGYLVGLNISGVTAPSAKTCVDKVITPRVGYTYTLSHGAAYTPTWVTGRYTSPVLIGGYSNSEQFPNGNQMMCFTTGNIWEVNPAGTIIWTKFIGNFSPQAHRYPPCFINNQPVQQPSITALGPNIVVTTGTYSAYQWYYNGSAIPTGTNAGLVATGTGVYLLRVFDGCYWYYTQNLFYTAPITTALAVLESELSKIQFYPNPTNGELELDMNSVSRHYQVEVRSSTGQLLLKEQDRSHFYLGEYGSGIYFITVITERGNITKKVTVLK